MHVVKPFKRLIYLTQHKARLRLLAGKRRGFILHKHVRTKRSIKNETLTVRHDKTITTTNLRIKRKKKYGKGGYKSKLFYTVLNLKSSRLQYRFNSEQSYIKTLRNPLTKRSRHKLKINLNHTNWKMYRTNKSAQQSRNLAVYNSAGASSFFNKKS